MVRIGVFRLKESVIEGTPRTRPDVWLRHFLSFCATRLRDGKAVWMSAPLRRTCIRILWALHILPFLRPELGVAKHSLPGAAVEADTLRGWGQHGWRATLEELRGSEVHLYDRLEQVCSAG